MFWEVLMEYRINDQRLTAAAFISFANQIWQGDYNLEKTAAALSKTQNITAYDGDKLVGCLRILSDGYFFWNHYRTSGFTGLSETRHWQQTVAACQRKRTFSAVFWCTAGAGIFL